MKKIQKERRCARMDDEANPHHPPGGWVAPGNADDDVNMDQITCLDYVECGRVVDLDFCLALCFFSCFCPKGDEVQ